MLVSCVHIGILRFRCLLSSHLMNIFPRNFMAPLVAESFYYLTCLTGGEILNSRSRLSTQPLVVFRVFSEIRVNTGQDPLERTPRRAFHLQALVPREAIGLNTNNNNNNINKFVLLLVLYLRIFKLQQQTLLLSLRDFRQIVLNIFFELN